MSRLSDVIERLEYEHRLWAEEIGTPGSGMKRADVRFLQTRIDRLKRLRERVDDTIERTLREIRDRH